MLCIVAGEDQVSVNAEISLTLASHLYLVKLSPLSSL